MHDSPFDSTLTALLSELKAKVLEEPQLAKEWEQALKQKPWSLQEELEDRFLEWFLLERESESLGTQPAVYWAPQSLQPADDWTRFLDASLGLFRPNGALNGKALLLDLWTGQNFQTAYPAFPDKGANSSFLLVGRLALNAAGVYQPLPGAQALMQEGLIQALDADIKRVRGQNPRERLSQLQLEYILLAHKSAIAAQGDSSLATQTVALIESTPGWRWAKAYAVATEHGPDELINQLAFSTDIDLDLVKGGLPMALAEAQTSERVASSNFNASDALHSYDEQRAAGVDLDVAFSALEAELGLPVGISNEINPEESDEGEAGPGNKNIDANYFLDAYLFDHQESAVQEFELSELKAIAGEISPQSSRQQIISIISTRLAQSPQESIFESRWSTHQPFLTWLCREQGFPLDEWLEVFPTDGLQRLRRAVTINSSHDEAPTGQASQIVRIISIKPLLVETQEKSQGASVLHAPKTVLEIARIGDLLIGYWKAGSFVMHKYLPLEILPEQPQSA